VIQDVVGEGFSALAKSLTRQNSLGRLEQDFVATQHENSIGLALGIA
jgi:hypothetical protein